MAFLGLKIVLVFRFFSCVLILRISLLYRKIYVDSDRHLNVSHFLNKHTKYTGNGAGGTMPVGEFVLAHKKSEVQ